MARDGSVAVLHLDATYGSRIAGRQMSSWAVDWQQPFKSGYWLEMFQFLSQNWSDTHLAAPTLLLPHQLQLEGHVIAKIMDDETVSDFVFDWEKAKALGIYRRDGAHRHVISVEPVGPDFEILVTAWVAKHPVVVSVDVNHDDDIDTIYFEVVSVRQTQLLLNRLLPWKAWPVVKPEEIPLQEVDSRPLMSQDWEFHNPKHMTAQMVLQNERPVFESQPPFFALDEGDHHITCRTNKATCRWCDSRCARSKPFRLQHSGVYFSSWYVRPDSRKGDIIVICRESWLPLVLRRRSRAGRYKYLGPAMILAGTWSGNYPCRDGTQSNMIQDAKSFVAVREWLLSELKGTSEPFILV